MKRNHSGKMIVVSCAIGALAMGFWSCGGGGGDMEQTQMAEKPAAQKPAQAAKPATATLTGTITFTGTVPKPTRIRMSSDPVCDKAHSSPVMTEEYIVGNGGAFANVFVYVKSGLEGQTFPPATDTVEFDQKGCEYYPHIFGIRVNQPLTIVNSDPTLHNVHALPKQSSEFNFAMPKQDMKVTKSFSAPEIMVKIKCDVHSWMNAYCGVLEHPFFAVTGKDGKFSIGPLPPGTYELEAWHEKAGTMTQTVTVGDNETKDVPFTFGASGS